MIVHRPTLTEISDIDSLAVREQNPRNSPSSASEVSRSKAFGRSRRRPVALLVCFFLLMQSALRLSAQTSEPYPNQSGIDSVWQYSIALEPGTERRAYLWIPPHCSKVRGVLFGLQNMLERPMFEDYEIRDAVASVDMAIVLVSPGSWPQKDLERQPNLEFKDAAESIAGIQTVLSGLAKESGYTEIEFVPLLLTGHSAASPFVWGVTRAWPGRVFAFLPMKGYHVDAIVPDVPTLKIEQEWAEWGANWGEVWQSDMQQAADKVEVADHPLFGDFADLGSGHFDWHHDAARIIGMFLRKAAEARLPTNPPAGVPIRLKPISPDSGVLVDPHTLGTSKFKAVPYRQWKGDSRYAFWYFDGEMADAINTYMKTRLEKKPEVIDFVVDDKSVPLTTNGFAAIKPQFLADGIHFRVLAQSLLASPSTNLYEGRPLGHADTAIVYRVSSGALLQTGPDTFMMGARSGGLTRQGQPWEPWIMAYEPGDAVYRSADRPAHILIDIRNKVGNSQTLKFEKLSDVTAEVTTVPLSAQASSGLPVQFYVESGPAIVEGNILRILSVPPRSHYPIKIIVSAYQWGRVGAQPVQSVGPETQEFFMRK